MITIESTGTGTGIAKECRAFAFPGDGRRRAAAAAAIVLFLAALTQLGGALVIHAKAQLAPVLLEQAWRRSRQASQPVRPWPWADMAPIAHLQVPRLGIGRIVLDSDAGHALAFAPGLSPAAAVPGSPGLAMISAHRDTHFRFLRRLRPGDELILDHGNRRLRYRVADYRIVDARDGYLAPPLPARGLLLVTCYPFEAIRPGGPLRYVLVAEDISSRSSAHRPAVSPSPHGASIRAALSGEESRSGIVSL